LEILETGGMWVTEEEIGIPHISHHHTLLWHGPKRSDVAVDPGASIDRTALLFIDVAHFINDAFLFFEKLSTLFFFSLTLLLKIFHSFSAL